MKKKHKEKALTWVIEKWKNTQLNCGCRLKMGTSRSRFLSRWSKLSKDRFISYLFFWRSHWLECIQRYVNVEIRRFNFWKSCSNSYWLLKALTYSFCFSSTLLELSSAMKWWKLLRFILFLFLVLVQAKKRKSRKTGMARTRANFRFFVRLRSFSSYDNVP